MHLILQSSNILVQWLYCVFIPLHSIQDVPYHWSLICEHWFPHSPKRTLGHSLCLDRILEDMPALRGGDLWGQSVPERWRVLCYIRNTWKWVDEGSVSVCKCHVTTLLQAVAAGCSWSHDSSLREWLHVQTRSILLYKPIKCNMQRAIC